jgi:hypothetical protein
LDNAALDHRQTRSTYSTTIIDPRVGRDPPPNLYFGSIFRYVDDPRNTDNAWMETVAFSFHDETGDKIGKFDLKAGDDAKDLKWMKLSEDLELYASHKDFLQKVAHLLDAHW